MSRAPDDLEPRKQARFSASQKFNILLRQSDEGADGVIRAFCDACGERIAALCPDGRWERLRPIDFDHSLARGLYGKTTTANGRAICAHPFTCHKIKSTDDGERIAKADAQAGRTGQYARRMARKARGERPQLQSRGFQRP